MEKPGRHREPLHFKVSESMNKMSSTEKGKAIKYNVLNLNWGFANQTSGLKVLPN